MVLRRKVQVFLYRHNPGLEVLLLKRAKTEKGEWHPVTGNVEPHEQIRAAAMREVEEETLCDVDPEPLGVTFTYEVAQGPRKGRFHETAFAASVPADEEIVLSEEHTGHEWVSVDEAMKRLNFADQKRALEALAKRYA